MRILFARIALLVMVCLAMLLPQSAALANSAGHKPVLALFPVIDNSSQKAGRVATEELNDQLADKFGSGKYVVLSGQTLLGDLKSEGINDFRNTDNATLQAALQRLGVDYSVRTELQYVTLKQKVSFPSVLLFIKTWMATVPLYINITDVNRRAAIFDTTLVETGRNEALIGFANQLDAVQNAMDKMLYRVATEVPLPN